MHSKTVGSSTAGRILACPRSHTLSKDVTQKSSVYAEEGTMLHAAMEAILEGKTENDTDVVDASLTQDLYDEMIAPALAAFDSLFDDRYEFLTEQRVYFPGIADSFGTADVIGTADTYSAIVDWKFGRGVEVQAKDNAQLLFAAAAGRHTFPDLFAHDRIHGVIIQPAYDCPKVWAFSHDEVDAFEAALTDAWGRRETEPLHEGPHCRFCPAQPICPAKREKVRRVQSLGHNEHIEPSALTELLPLAEEMLEWARAVKQYAHDELERGVRIPGYKLVQKRATRQWSDDDDAERYLRSLRMPAPALYPRKLTSVAQAEKWIKTHSTARALKRRIHRLDELTIRHSSGTTLAPVDDKRPALEDRNLEKLKNVNTTHAF